MCWPRFRGVLAVVGLWIAMTGVMPIVGGCSRRSSPPARVSEQEIREFRNALYDGDAAIIDRLLTARPALVNVRDENGKTPLTVAKERGDDDVVQVLRRHGGTE